MEWEPGRWIWHVEISAGRNGDEPRENPTKPL
jgi:hypothetical protein